MKKSVLIILFAVLFVAGVNAECDLNVILLNQDPYPAVQGDYVELVFQVQGIESIDCKQITFSLVPEYPFSLDPGVSNIITIPGGTFVNDYNSFFMIPYKVRVDENAVDGINPIRVRYSTGISGSSYISEKFDVEIQELKSNFEIFVKDYVPETNILTLEILNSGKNDVEGLTLEIPPQENIKIKGPNYKIVGALDSNDFTTTTFEAIPNSGDIKINIYYTDSIFTRRNLEKTVKFNSEPFIERTNGKKSNNYWIYLIILAVIIIAFYYYRKIQNEKRKKRLFG